MVSWLRNVVRAVVTVAQAMWVGLRYWSLTYRTDRGTFTERFEYPEKPAAIRPRYRGFHRYDLTSCIGCERCAKDCPAGCIYVTKHRGEGHKGFQVGSFCIDYTKCMLCGLCTENCPMDCIFLGASHDLSCYTRDGCIVDFARLPLEIAWGRATLEPLAVARSKRVVEPVDRGPNA